MRALTLCALSALSASAQITPVAPPKAGYVVRVDSNTVWLDFTAADGSSLQRPFTILKEGPELKHPVTGADLGRVEIKIGEGVVTGVSDKHSVGVLTSKTEEIKPGAKARWVGAPPEVPAPPAARAADGGLRSPKTRGANLPYAVAAMTTGDFDGIGKPQLVLSDEKSFKLYAYPAAADKPLVEGQIAGTAARIVSLEAADLDGNGRSELFVTIYNEPFRRLETFVYTIESGKWIKAAELPYMVRAHQDSKGERVIASQQIQDDKSFPFGAIYPLAYIDGRYEQRHPAITARRVDWLYAFTYAQLDSGESALLYLTSVNSLRAQFSKGHWRSPESFGQSPVRVRWHDRMLEFNPPMVASYSDARFQTLYVVRNLAMLGGLANPFGLFNGGELHALNWTGVAFELKWKADLGGSSQGFALVEPEPGRKELVVAVTGSTGKSAVWTFEP
ncbi:MAG: VCBS repeat-containing protein [Elusimicrobiota bacterium]